MSTLRHAQLKTSTSPTRREESKQSHQNEKSGSNGGGIAKRDPKSLKGWGFFTSRTMSKIFLSVYARKNFHFFIRKEGLCAFCDCNEVLEWCSWKCRALCLFLFTLKSSEDAGLINCRLAVADRILFFFLRDKWTFEERWHSIEWLTQCPSFEASPSSHDNVFIYTPMISLLRPFILFKTT